MDNDNLDIVNLGLLLMFVTGVRVGELVAIKPEDVEGNVIVREKSEIDFSMNSSTSSSVMPLISLSPKTEKNLRKSTEYLSKLALEISFVSKRLSIHSWNISAG